MNRCRGDRLQLQKPQNLSARRHGDWQLREIGSLGLHFKLGAVAVLFEFRPAGEATAFPFVFLGPGVGLGAQMGAGATSFPRADAFIGQTAQVIGRSLWQVGRGLIGREVQPVPPPAYADSFMTFVDIATDAAFSALDLHRAFGSLVTGKASAPIGASFTFVTARKGTRRLFTRQSTTGTGNSAIGGGSGVALGASANPGWWVAMSRD